MPFQKAIRKQKKARISLAGPSGSGKTYTALAIAGGLGERVAVIDTERGSASLYSDVFQFDTCELAYFGVDEYIKAIGEAAQADYDVLVIDSLSHAWVGTGGVLDAVNNAGGKNTFTDGWGKVGTPAQNRLIDAILNAPIHVIVTMRTKTDYDVIEDERGRKVPTKVGLAAIQRDGIEYEFDISGRLGLDNRMHIEKARYVELQGKIIDKPGADLGKRILAWLNSGEADAPRALETIIADAAALLEMPPKNGASPAQATAIKADWSNVFRLAHGHGLTLDTIPGDARLSAYLKAICDGGRLIQKHLAEIATTNPEDIPA